MYEAIEDESEPLLPEVSGEDHGGETNGNNGRSKKNTHIIHRVLIILLMAASVALSIWFQSFQTELTQKLSTDEEKIQQLEKTIVEQGKIIARFNESVTNKDVIGKLEKMESQWDQERKDLFDQLEMTKNNVDKELNTTMVELDKTVKAAEAEIHEQVDAVKKNFDQYVVKTEHRFSMENNFMKYQVAGTFTILSCLISMWHMGSHTRKMNQPAIQRKILAILWMCPIYAVTSCLSLVLPKYAGYLGIIKDFYEAYIIYQFLSFCISAIGGGDRNKVIEMLAKQVDHLAPPFRLFFCCCKPHYENDRALASAILLQCQSFAMQFVLFKPVTAISMLVLKKTNYYGPYADDATDWKSIQFWVVIIQNVSTFVAFAGLLKFYHAVDKELQWCRPFAKFLCIKGVVFMTFWQGSALRVLAETTEIGKDDDGKGVAADTWSEQIQNFLICLEMLVFSIAHFYCFPVDEWQPGYKVNFRKAKFGETMALNDFFTDLKIIMTTGDGTKKKKKTSNALTESTIPEEEGGDGESETVNDSVSAMENSVDEEDAKDAFVRALTSGINSYEDEKADGLPTEKKNAHEAQERLGTMLDEMLFSTEDSTLNSPKVSSGTQRPTLDDGIYSVKTWNEQNDEENAIADMEREHQNEPTGYRTPRTEQQKEPTGLLTGERATSLTSNLKPSIFTTISERQVRKDDCENVEGDQNEIPFDRVRNHISKEEDLEEQRHDY